jgi:spermidine synthase
VAKRFFRLPQDERLQVATEDGRRYLVKNERKYDVIVLDTFFEDGIPFHLTTREFLELVRSRLNPGGVVMTNTIGALTGDGSKLFRAIYRTYRSAFPTVVVHPVDAGERSGELQNLIIVAGEGAEPSEATLQERWRAIRQRVSTAPDLADGIRRRVDGAIAVGDVPLLTDDYAPTDALLLY